MKKSVTTAYLKYVQRPILAFFRMPGSQGFGILLLLFLIIVALAVFDLKQNYVDPDTKERLDWVHAFYTVFALLVFESPLDFPDQWITRLVFFAIPVFGIVVVGQGLVRWGRIMLDRDSWDLAMASTYQHHTIVCGLGKVGYKVVRWILDLNEEAVVVDVNPNDPFVAEVRGWGVPVIIADARRPEILEDMNIAEAESIVACTDDDLANLSIALQARKLVPGIKVVLRMFDSQMAENVRDGFDIRTAFSISDISAPAFAVAATRAPLDHAVTFEDDGEKALITITKFVLVQESVLVGYAVKQLEDEFDVAIIGYRRDGEFNIHPADDLVLQAGDRFVVSASIESLNNIAALTPPRREIERYYQGRWPLKGAEDLKK